MAENSLKPVQLLMLDFDGTITDSIPAAILSVQAMLKELSFPFKTAEEINIHVGYGEIPLIAGSIDSNDPALINKALETYYQHYRTHGLKSIKAYPGVKEFLDKFADKKKYIVSNKKEEFIRLIMDNLGLSHYFKEMVGGDSTACPKPDPYTLLRLLNEEKIKPENAMFIGDMTIDIETGKNAKVLTCAVTYGFDPREKLAALKPDFLVDNLMDLARYIY
ncbi:MAG: HAD family hydrolase [Candidatus Margulisiibacteriota bacterium]